MESLFAGALNILPQLFYLLSMALLSIIDVFQLLFRKLAGLDTYYVDGTAQTGDIVSDFLTGILFGGYPILSSVFLGLIILGVILLFLSTIVAIIRNEYTTDKAENSKGKIIGKAFKSVIYFAIIPVVCIFGVYLANVVLVAVDKATTYNTNYYHTLDTSKLQFVPVYNQSFANLNNASSAEKTYITYTLFGLTDSKTGLPYGTTTTTFSGTIFKASAYWANRVRNSDKLTDQQIANGAVNYAELIKTGEYTNFKGLFSDASGNTEAIAIKIDIAFADNVVFNEQDCADQLNFNNAGVRAANNYQWSPWESPEGKTYTFANKYDIQLVWYYYDLWSFNYVIALGAAIIMVSIFINIIFGLMRRLIELVGLFLMAPPLIALMPLDEEKAYKEWRKAFLSKTLMAYGAIGGMNVVMLLLPELQRISFFNNEPLDLIANTLLILVALLAVKSFISLVSGLIGGADANKEGGDIAKEAGETVAKGMKIAATTAGLAIGVGGLALGAGKAVVGTAGKAVYGGALRAKMAVGGADEEFSKFQSDKKRFHLREQHREEAKDIAYNRWRKQNINDVDKDLQNDAHMVQLKNNDGAAYHKVLEQKTREKFETDLKSPGHPLQRVVEAEFESLQRKTKVTNAEMYAKTSMAGLGTKMHEAGSAFKETYGLREKASWLGQYGGQVGGFVKKNAIDLTKPLVHRGQLVLKTYGDILLDNNFAKGFKDNDSLEDAQLRFFKGITKKDADKAKEKKNKADDQSSLVSAQREAFKAAFKEALEETKNK